MKIRFGYGTLDGNHHIMRPKPGGPHPRYEGHEFDTKRSTIGFCALGRDSYLKAKGRTLFGLRLWIYGPSGACVRFDAYLLFDKSPYRPPSKYAPQDDGGIGTVML